MTELATRRGSSLAEALVAIAIVALLVSVAVPGLTYARSRARMEAATQQVAALFRRCRSEAVSRSRPVAVNFQLQGTSYAYALYEDSNGDGIKTADIISGRDRLIGGPWRLRDTTPGVEFSILQGRPIRKIPPQTGNLTNTSDPLQFGSVDLVSFTPLGSCTGGTAYLSDGDRMEAIVLYGPTGRSRIWRYVNEQNIWVQ